MPYLGGHCQNGVTLRFPSGRPCDLQLIRIWTWSVFGICFAAAVLWISWMMSESWMSSGPCLMLPLSRFYFWTHSWNWVYYNYCQPFNSLMIAYWISGSLYRAVAPHVSGSQCDRSVSIKQAVVSSHITISSLHCTLLNTNHTNISEIWPLLLTIESNSLQLVYVYPRQ